MCDLLHQAGVAHLTKTTRTLSVADYMTTSHRFWAKVNRLESDDCWPWTSPSVGRDGRGRMSVNGRRVNAPMVSWVLSNGIIPPKGQFACHSCDNPNCVNPSHIWICSNAENMQDASRKKRINGQSVTHCPKGHEYTEETTAFRKNGRRYCKPCQYAYRAVHDQKPHVAARRAELKRKRRSDARLARAALAGDAS